MSASNDSAPKVATFYELYKDRPLPIEYILFQSILFTFASISMLMNGLIVVVSLKSKRLNLCCHRLITIDALSTSIFMLYRVTPFTLAISGIKFMPLSTCFFFQAIPEGATIFSSGVILIVGIERLSAVLFPMWWQYAKFNWHTFLLLAINFFHTFYILYKGYEEKSPLNNIFVQCQISDLLQGNLSTLSLNRTLVVHIAIGIIYAFLWLAIRLKSNQTNSASHRNMTKCICILAVIDLFYWIPTGMFLGQFLAAFQLDQNGLMKFSFVFALCTILVYSTNLPVVYFFSKIYRDEIGQFLRGNHSNGVNSRQNRAAMNAALGPALISSNRTKCLPTVQMISRG